MPPRSILHDFDARNDERMVELRMRHGAAGYGIFWMLIEMMGEATNHRLSQKRLNALAYSCGATSDECKAVIATGLEIGLLEEENGCFFSPSLNRRISAYVDRSTQARLSAEARWKNRSSPSEKEPSKESQEGGGNANALPEHCVSNANALQEQCYSNAHSYNTIQYNTPPLLDLNKGGSGGKTKPEVLIELTAHELSRLTETFGVEAMTFYLPYLQNYLNHSRKRCSDHFSFISNWIEKDRNQRDNFYATGSKAASKGAGESWMVHKGEA